MLGTLLGAVIALTPGAHAAQEPFCRPPPKVSEAELGMRSYQRIRRRYGFRADRAYIRSLIRRELVFTVDVERFPMTRRERRYVRLRDRLQLDDAAERYLHRHREVDGGLSIEDAWPRDPYLLARLTRELPEHRRALRRLVRYPRLLRTKRVALSQRQLGRLQDRINWRAAERDGFVISTTAPDIDTTTVEVELITERTDAAAYFRERYGPDVRAKVIGTELYKPACRPMDGYGADGPRLTVTWNGDGGDRFDHVEVIERDDRVEIGIVVQAYQAGIVTFGPEADHVVELSRPLGDRKVIDATTGRAVGRPRFAYR